MGKLTEALFLYMASPLRRQSVQSDVFFEPGSERQTDGQMTGWQQTEQQSSRPCLAPTLLPVRQLNNYFCICVSFALLEWTVTCAPQHHLLTCGSVCYTAELFNVIFVLTWTLCYWRLRFYYLISGIIQSQYK